ncbi:MAG: hypothetical protein QMD11_10560 [Smithella sp.]|nr:hypothetical protein [Smithella sp.]
MGGREIPIFTRTCAIAGADNTMIDAKNNAPIINFFILLSPLHINILSILALSAFRNQMHNAVHWRNAFFINI